MLKDIALGQYYPVNSILHRLDPRVKLLGTILYMIGLFLCSFYTGYIFHALVLAVVIWLSKIPFGQMAKSVKPILILLLFSVSFTILFTNGENILFEYGILHISLEGMILAAEIVVRIVLLILMSTVLTLTTTPTDLADGLEKSCHFFKKVGVPVHEIAMMITIALRFIPILMEETDKMIRAQKARGADFESGGLFQKAKSLIPILVPLVLSSMRHASDLAIAMEARCYRGGEGRTKMKPLCYQKRDKMAYLFWGLYVIVILIGKIINIV